MASKTRPWGEELIPHRRLVENDAVHCCLNCEHFDKQNDQCATYQVKPPCEVIVYGCDEWEPEIPF